MRLDPRSGRGQAAARREVGSGELARGDEGEDVRIDPRAEGFDAISNQRIAPMLVAVKETDLQRHAFARQCSRQPSGLDHDAIIDHR